MRTLLLLALGLLALAPAAPVQAEDEAPYVAESVTGLKVLRVPRALRRRSSGFHKFYRRYTSLEGFTIQASDGPAEAALLEAAWVIRNMLAKRRDILDTLRWRGIRLAIMAHDELTTMIPEHASLSPAKWWDYRARGLGPGARRPVVSVGEENLLGYRGDPYAGESILIHEFAHAIDLEALRYLDKDFEAKLERTFKAAIADGLWKGCYAATNKEEYWAEGVQGYFDANRGKDSQHNDVDTREELAAYDPRLYALIATVFRHTPWRYRPAPKRAGRGHLRGYDPAKAPTFAWPKGLADWYWAYERKKKSGEGRERLKALPLNASPKRSPVTHRETRILFVNESGRDVKIFWLGYDGKRMPYGTLRAGASGERETLTYHVWVITDDAGEELCRFRAGRRAGRAVIPAPKTTK